MHTLTTNTPHLSQAFLQLQLLPFPLLIFASMDSTPRDSASTRENTVHLFREVQGIFDKFFKFLFSIIAFKITDAGEAFAQTHPSLTTTVVSAFVVYFLAWLLATILQPHVKSPLPIITFIILTIAGIASVLPSTIIL